MPGRMSAERVYEAIKARVIAYEFPQGKRIYLEPLAEQLGVSTIPVREALNRLAEDGLLTKAPRKGFHAMRLSEENIRGRYIVSRTILLHELESLSDDNRGNLSGHSTIATVLNRLNRRRPAPPRTLASSTAEIFAHIAALSDNPLVLVYMGRANDHLYYVRTAECRYLDNAHDELVRLCELFLAGDCRELALAINAYHNRRLDLLPTVLAALRERRSASRQ